MDDRIIDGMKKEGRPFKYSMLVGYVLAIVMPLSIYLTNDDKYTHNDLISFAVAWVVFGTLGLYGWLYTIHYRVAFDNEKVRLKTLFKDIQLNVCDIEKYTCKRYRKSVFYQFHLFVNGKKVLINTRYKDQFERILKDNKIEQMIQ